MSLTDNFRRDLASKVNEFSKLIDIDNKSEKITDPKTFNIRFRTLSHSMRSLFEALSDLASRDKKYLQSFFLGYVNPVYVKSYTYTNKSAYVQNSAFQNNGIPVNFAETRIYYDHNSYSNLVENDAYPLVFKNGKLLYETNWDVYNTASGLRLFVKDTAVSNNDTITLVISKKFNTVINGWNFVNNINRISYSTTFQLTYENVGNFYHKKYLKLYLKLSGKTYYSEVDPANYTIDIDVTGTNLSLVVNQQLNVGDRLQLLNTTTFWSKITTFTTTSDSCCTNPTIPLISDSGLPVPFQSNRDFDVYYDNIKLLPDKHYKIIRSISSSNPDEIAFLFDVPSSQSHTVRIYKNEPYFPNDSVLIEKSTLDLKGLEQYNPNALIPLMPLLGYLFISGRFYENSVHLKTRHRSLLEVFNVDAVADFSYCMKLVTTQELEELLNQLGSVPSEMDTVVELLGLDSVKLNLYSTLPNITVTNNETIDSALAITNYNPQVYKWLLLYKWIEYQKTLGQDIIIDNNLELPSYFDGLGDFDLNGNECSCNDIIIDTNLTF